VLNIEADDAVAAVTVRDGAKNLRRGGDEVARVLGGDWDAVEVQHPSDLIRTCVPVQRLLV
jgi:hypothetical protein